MIWKMIKKQAIIFTRNPLQSQAILLVGLPMLLITILGLSLGSFINDDGIKITAKLAFIEHDDEAEQVEQFISEIRESTIPHVEQQAIVASAENFKVLSLLKESVFDDISEFVQVEYVSISDKERILKDDSFAALIEIPAGFTKDSLKALFLNVGEVGQIKVYGNKSKRIGADVVTEIIEDVEKNLAIHFFAANNHVDPEVLQIEREFGSRKTTHQLQSINSKEYYTIGMAVMNVLYIASAISYFAFREKATHIFNRIIISNISRWTYFTGIFLSGMMFALIQLLLVFGYAYLVFGVSWPLLPFFITTVFMAMAVGGLSVLLTAITYRINSEAVISFFGSILIGIFALVGGSFFPVGDFVDVIQAIGNYTPNGAGMTTYINILRGEGILENIRHLLFLGAFTLSLLVIAVLSFPKRGQMA